MKSKTMPLIKTTWRYDPTMEACRLIEMANRIVTGFYESKGFYVVPFESRNKLSNTPVTFPDLDYSKIPRFWQRVQRIEYHHFPIKTDKNFIFSVEELMKFSPELVKPINNDKLRNDWERIMPDVVQFIAECFPSNHRVKSLEVFMSNFGTTSTFRLASKYPADVRIYLRYDATIYHLLFGLFSSITRNEVFNDLKGEWEESQLLVDWLLSKTSLSQKIDDLGIPLTPSIKSLKKLQDPNLALITNDFYQKLGISTLAFDFSVKNKNEIYVGKTKLKGLTEREKDIMKILIENKSNVVSTDTIAGIVFDNSEDFSLYAISKTIERLRNKLEKNGISSTFIQTKRGEGYILV